MSSATSVDAFEGHALQSRIAIEQAKGVIAERSGLDIDQAFAWMRQHARSRTQLLIEVAQGVIDGTVMPSCARPTESEPF